MAMDAEMAPEWPSDSGTPAEHFADLERWVRREMYVNMWARESHMFEHGERHAFDDCPQRVGYIAAAGADFERWELTRAELSRSVNDMITEAFSGITPPASVLTVSPASILESAQAIQPLNAETTPAQVRVDKFALDVMRRMARVAVCPPPLVPMSTLAGLPVRLDPNLPLGGWEIRSATGAVLSSGTLTGC